MYGIQVHKDNYIPTDYRLALNSAIIMICMILLPLYSIVLFALVNYYWVTEVIVNINVSFANIYALAYAIKPCKSTEGNHKYKKYNSI